MNALAQRAAHERTKRGAKIDAHIEQRETRVASFAAFSGEDVPDPQAEETFLRSKLAPHDPDPLYRELLALRRDAPRELTTEVDADVLRMRRGRVELVADFAAKTVELRR